MVGVAEGILAFLVLLGFSNRNPVQSDLASANQSTGNNWNPNPPIFLPPSSQQVNPGNVQTPGQVNALSNLLPPIAGSNAAGTNPLGSGIGIGSQVGNVGGPIAGYATNVLAVLQLNVDNPHTDPNTPCTFKLLALDSLNNPIPAFYGFVNFDGQTLPQSLPAPGTDLSGTDIFQHWFSIGNHQVYVVDKKTGIISNTVAIICNAVTQTPAAQVYTPNIAIASGDNPTYYPANFPAYGGQVQSHNYFLSLQMSGFRPSSRLVLTFKTSNYVQQSTNFFNPNPYVTTTDANGNATFTMNTGATMSTLNTFWPAFSVTAADSFGNTAFDSSIGWGSAWTGFPN